MKTAADQGGSFRCAWVLLSLALAVHVLDEALTGFLAVYNPTVLAMKARLAWFPMPTFTFRMWLAGLIALCVLLLILTVWANQRYRIMKIAAYILTVIMIFNAAGHTLGTIFGRTVSGITFARPMPGFYSSPLLLAASIYLLVAVRRKRTMVAAAS